MLFFTDRLESLSIFFLLFLDIVKLIPIKSVGVWVFYIMKKAGSRSQKMMLFLCTSCSFSVTFVIWQELTITFLGGTFWRRLSPPSFLLFSSVAYDRSAISCDIIQHKKDSNIKSVKLSRQTSLIAGDNMEMDYANLAVDKSREKREKSGLLVSLLVATLNLTSGRMTSMKRSRVFMNDRHKIVRLKKSSAQI